VTALDEIWVLKAPCSDCSLMRTLGVERSAQAVVPAPGPTRQEVIVEVVVTVLAGCSRCA
jgi:hypothetical protein